MEFVFRCFSLGDACVPAGGMQRIPEQLASKLVPGSVMLNHRVEAIEPGRLRVCYHHPRGTKEIGYKSLVLACPGGGIGAMDERVRRWRSVTNVCFAGEGTPPVKVGALMLDGDGPAINVAIMSNVSDAYAPRGKYLISATVPGVPAGVALPVDQSLIDARPPTELIERVRTQLGAWWTMDVARSWRHLRTYVIERALPDQSPPWYTERDWPVRVGEGVYRAGDTVDLASIDGAMRSGRRAAQALLADR
jgi:hypothetical protein